MIDVTKEQFYKALYADKRDIMPFIVGGYSQVNGYTQEWRTNDGNRTLFGISIDKPETYQLAEKSG